MTLRIVQTTLLGLAAVVFAQPAFCEHPDLSGNWQLDVSASTLGPTRQFDGGVLTISTGPHKMLHIQVTLKSPHGEQTIDRDFKVDNRYHPEVGDESGELLAKWDGAVLSGTRQTDAGPEQIRLILGADGQTLTETIQTSQGLQTRIWRRQ